MRYTSTTLMIPQSSSPDADMLSHATVQVAASLPAASIARLIGALQRVPGVLLADWVPSTARAIVAHDAAVPVAALLAAAGGTGLDARILDTPATAVPAIGGVAKLDVRLRRLFAVAAMVMFVGAVVVTLDPRLANSQLILPLLLGALWAVIIAEAIIRRIR